MLDKKGYMITSDLSLQDQYESDFYRLGLHWPSVKGVDNYECSVNGLPFSLGDCRLKAMSYEQASKLECYGNCQYLQNRERAINHRVTLLNYAFWLLQRNYVEDQRAEEGGSPFAASGTGASMSCYKCGLHKPRALGSFKRVLNQSMFVCADCKPS